MVQIIFNGGTDILPAGVKQKIEDILWAASLGYLWPHYAGMSGAHRIIVRVRENKLEVIKDPPMGMAR